MRRSATGYQRGNHPLPHRQRSRPHPYPMLVRDFQSVIGREPGRKSWRPKDGCRTTWWPVSAAAATPSEPFTSLSATRLWAWLALRPAAKGWKAVVIRPPSAPDGPECCTAPCPICCRDEHGQVQETHSISAGLDYPGVWTEHSYLKDAERAEYVAVTDDQGAGGFHLLCRTEGIIPALEPSLRFITCANGPRVAAGADNPGLPERRGDRMSPPWRRPPALRFRESSGKNQGNISAAEHGLSIVTTRA